MSLIVSHQPLFHCNCSSKIESFCNPSRPNTISSPLLFFSRLKNLRPDRFTAIFPLEACPKPSQNPSFSVPLSSFKVLLRSFIFFSIILSLRLFLSLLPPDFPKRWHRLQSCAEEAESMAAHLPSHLWQAVVACEDRRFFRHFGIDLIGISRAVLLFPDGGGGSTITQQLVKNVFLKHGRKMSRKIVEMVLALMLERKMSKWKILWSYLSKIYWGHGVYGIEAASAFYFGKHPSLLSFAESAMLAGIIPSPDLRSPFREPSRGQISQARALRKMVEAGLLDFDSAILVLKQPLCLCIDDSKLEDRSSHKEVEGSGKQMGKISAVENIWDWDRASAEWEAREYMEKWGRRIRMRNFVFVPIKKRNVVFLSFSKLN